MIVSVIKPAAKLLRGWSLVTLFLTAFLLMLLPAPVFADTYYVATNGADTNPGTREQPFRTIQKAATVACPGDTVLIRAGTYRETVSPQRSGEAGRPITFRNYEREAVVVSGAEVVSAAAWKAGGQQVFLAAVPMPLESDNQLFLDGRMMTEARFPNSPLDVSHPVKLTAKSGSFTGQRGQAVGTIHHDALNQAPDHWVGASLQISLGKVWIAETVKVIASGPGWVRFTFREGKD